MAQIENKNPRMETLCGLGATRLVLAPGMNEDVDGRVLEEVLQHSPTARHMVMQGELVINGRAWTPADGPLEADSDEAPRDDGRLRRQLINTTADLAQERNRRRAVEDELAALKAAPPPAVQAPAPTGAVPTTPVVDPVPPAGDTPSDPPAPPAAKSKSKG